MKDSTGSVVQNVVQKSKKPCRIEILQGFLLEGVVTLDAPFSYLI